MSDPSQTVWDELSGKIIVLDVSSPYVILGRLVRRQDDWIVMSDVDVHDLRDTTTTREKYILDSRLHGIRPNRREAWVRLEEIVCLSRWDDVISH